MPDAEVRSERLMSADKIKRSFLWLRKTLRVIDKTTLPGQILGEVRPTLDTFGWERLAETEFETATSAVGGSNVQFAAVPPDTVHLYLQASVRITVAGPFNVWVGVRQPSGGTVALTRLEAAILLQKVAPLARPVIIPEGCQLEARSEAAIVAGTMILEAFRIVLPAGEYIPPS